MDEENNWGILWTFDCYMNINAIDINGSVFYGGGHGFCACVQSCGLGFFRPCNLQDDGLK